MLPANIRVGLRTPESQLSGSSDKPKQNFSRESHGCILEQANHLPRDRSQDGKNQHKGPVKETGKIRGRGISRAKVALGVYPEFVDTLRMLHDTIFWKILWQRLVHSIQDDGVAKIRNLPKFPRMKLISNIPSTDGSCNQFTNITSERRIYFVPLSTLEPS